MSKIFFVVGNVFKAVESAATFMALEPSSESMSQNIQFYLRTFKLTPEDMIPRKVHTFQLSWIIPK